jgi:hypothetical protein
MEVRCEPALGFDGGEVLDLVARTPAKVLDEPVDQLRKVQGVERSAPVVVPGWVDGDALGGHRPVARQRERDEHRRPIGPSVRGGEHAADRAILHRHPREIRRVLSAPSRPHPPVARVVVGLVVVAAFGLVVLRRAVTLWFGVEVPALAALLDTQSLGALGARWAAVLASGPARDGHELGLARGDVGDAGDHRAGTHISCERGLAHQCRVCGGCHAAAPSGGRVPSRRPASVTGSTGA